MILLLTEYNCTYSWTPHLISSYTKRSEGENPGCFPSPAMLSVGDEVVCWWPQSDVCFVSPEGHPIITTEELCLAPGRSGSILHPPLDVGAGQCLRMPGAAHCFPSEAATLPLCGKQSLERFHSHTVSKQRKGVMMGEIITQKNIYFKKLQNEERKVD